jgi:hypothetical protein
MFTVKIAGTTIFLFINGEKLKNDTYQVYIKGLVA